MAEQGALERVRVDADDVVAVRWPVRGCDHGGDPDCFWLDDQRVGDSGHVEAAGRAAALQIEALENREARYGDFQSIGSRSYHRMPLVLGVGASRMCRTARLRVAWRTRSC